MPGKISVLAAGVLLAGPAWGADPGATAMALLGKGVQIYVCTPVGYMGTWKLKGPEAVLTDAAGRRVGTHFAGPSWRATDGSVVVGEPLVASESPARAIPWLVLKVKEHTGEGVFSKVAFIVRTATKGGVAPLTGCDPAHDGAELRVAYTASYTLFPGQ